MAGTRGERASCRRARVGGARGGARCSAGGGERFAVPGCSSLGRRDGHVVHVGMVPGGERAPLGGVNRFVHERSTCSSYSIRLGTRVIRSSRRGAAERVTRVPQRVTGVGARGPISAMVLLSRTVAATLLLYLATASAQALTSETVAAPTTSSRRIRMRVYNALGCTGSQIAYQMCACPPAPAEVARLTRLPLVVPPPAGSTRACAQPRIHGQETPSPLPPPSRL